MDTNVAISVNGQILGVWVESTIWHNDGQNTLEASFEVTPGSLTGLLDALCTGFGSGFINSPLYEILGEINCHGAMLWQSDGPFAAAGTFGSLSLGVVRSGTGTLLLIRNAPRELTGVQNDDFSDFCESLLNAFGSVELLFGYKNGSIDITSGKKILSKLDAKLCGFELPNKRDINDASIVAFAEIQPNRSNLTFFKELAKLLPDGTRASLTAAFGSSRFVMLRIEPGVNNSNTAVNIKNLDCSLVLNGSPSIQLSGKMAIITGNRELSFLIDSKASTQEFSILAEYEDRSSPAFSGGFFNLNDLALAISLKNGALVFGGWGDISISTLNLFALLFLKSEATMSLNAFAVSFSRLSIAGILSCFGLRLDGADELDFLTVEPLPLVSQKMDTTAFTKSYDEIAAAFSSVCAGDCGGKAVQGITGDDILVKIISDGKGGISGYILADKKNVRHYEIGLSGEISLAPQLYYCVEDIDLGNYVFYKGIFVCASLNIFGGKINVFLQVDEKNGIEALVNVAPIDCSWFKLTAAPHSSRMRGGYALAQQSDSLVSQYLYANNDGPTLYICAKKGNFSVYFSAAVEILGIVDLSAYLLVDADRFLMDAQADLFGLNARVKLDVARGSSEMYFMAELDLSAFQNITKKVVDTVKKAVAEFQSKLADADSRLADAEKQVLKLQNQITAVDNDIRSLTNQLRSLKWWQFYKAPYLAILIGAKELEKAGIYIALGAALTALEIARGVLKLVGQVSGLMGELIAMLATAISSIFFIKRVALEIGADKSKNIALKMELCFTLFGQDKKISAGISTGGDVKGRIISTADSKVSDEVDSELQKYDKAENALYEVSENIFDYLSDSDFIYSDCDGYRQCLNDGLDFVDKAAVTEAIMEQYYKQAFKGDDPMSDVHSGSMLSRLSEVKAGWQSMFDAVSEINCDAIIEEAEAELLGREVFLGEDIVDAIDTLDEFKEKAAALRRLQDDISDDSRRIDEMDRRYVVTKRDVLEWLNYMMMDGEEPSDEPAEDYCCDLFDLFSAQDQINAEGPVNRRAFAPNDMENYFINPANEPALDRLFASVCEEAESEEIRELVDRIRADADGKSNPQNYRIRI